MFDFQRITLFCLEKRLSRQIVTIVSKYLGGMAPLTPLATPMLNLFPKPWYWDQPRKTLKSETVLTLNLVKNYQVSNRNSS